MTLRLRDGRLRKLLQLFQVKFICQQEVAKGEQLRCDWVTQFFLDHLLNI